MFRRIVLSIAVVASSALAVAPAPATAVETTSLPQTVTADALPTTQVNGVVWDQAIVGNTVYAVGSFTTARPAGAAPGTDTTPRSNVLAYNIATGELDASFAPQVDGTVNTVKASADGSRLYIGGSFTSVDGQARQRIAALDTRTGALVAGFAPTLNGTVNDIAVGTDTVYAGGSFTAAGSAEGTAARVGVAAFSTSDGSLVDSFAPTAAGGPVYGLALSPGGARLAIGGKFTTLDGSSDPGYGLALVSTSDGSVLPTAVNDSVRNAGDNAAVWSLTAAGDGFYGTAYSQVKAGTLEGVFRASWNGDTVWIADCHGDSYDVAPVGDVVYYASHTHYCGNLGDGGVPQTDPQAFYHGDALTRAATGVNRPDLYGYPDHTGEPSPSELEFFPNFANGTYTGMNQATWDVTASEDGSYVVMGGEFPSVNGTAQQGLVRFARASAAPNRVGPALSGAGLRLAARSTARGTVQLSWTPDWDRDGNTLTYRLYRDDSATAIWSSPRAERMWESDLLTHTDTGATPGSRAGYRLQVCDPDGNCVSSSTAAVTVATSPTADRYGRAVLSDGATTYWRLDGTGTAVTDDAGTDDTTAGAGVTLGAPGAVTGDHTAAAFASDYDGQLASNRQVTGRDTFSEEVWFRTSSTDGGRITSFDDTRTGSATRHDRSLYLGDDGRARFTVWSDLRGRAVTLTSPTSLADGAWHQLVGTLGPDGMTLYVDGRAADRDPATTTAQHNIGYWRLGYGSTWSGAAGFDGDLDEFSVYPTALTASQVDAHWSAARGRSGTLAPGSYATTVLSSAPDVLWQFSSSSSAVTDASANDIGAIAAGSLSTGRPGVTGGDTAISLGASGRVVARRSTTADGALSAQVWVRTASRAGGRILALDASPGAGPLLAMRRDGRISLSAPTESGTAAVTSSRALNDGRWHLITATIGSGRMRLYVDAAQNASTSSGALTGVTGRWRLGATAQPAAPALAARYDQIAGYTRALTAGEVAAAFRASTAYASRPPSARFTARATGPTVTVDASGSSAGSSPIARYRWSFGRDGAATGQRFTHTYATSGRHTITLTVTGADGRSATARQVVSTIANLPPTATLDASATGLRVAFDAARSTDLDGSVRSWRWSFGDGRSATGATATHTYRAPGTYRARLSVTDNSGATTSATRAITVSNLRPSAAIATSLSGLRLRVDGSASRDPDGRIVSYAWDFGDGRRLTGARASHTYARSGTYTVRLRVTDDHGAVTGRSVTVTAPASLVARDSFDRTTARGWGAAEAGGAWALTGSATDFSASAGAGRMRLPAPSATRWATLPVDAADADATVTVAADRLTDQPVFAGLTSRWTSATSAYRARLRFNTDGSVDLQLGAVAPGSDVTWETVRLPGAAYAAGRRYVIRMLTTGSDPTTVSAKAWVASGSEPGGWQLSHTDSTEGLQGTGGVGVYGYVSAKAAKLPVSWLWDDLSVTKPAN